MCNFITCLKPCTSCTHFEGWVFISIFFFSFFKMNCEVGNKIVWAIVLGLIPIYSLVCSALKPATDQCVFACIKTTWTVSGFLSYMFSLVCLFLPPSASILPVWNIATSWSPVLLKIKCWQSEFYCVVQCFQGSNF